MNCCTVHIAQFCFICIELLFGLNLFIYYWSWFEFFISTQQNFLLIFSYLFYITFDIFLINFSLYCLPIQIINNRKMQFVSINATIFINWHTDMVNGKQKSHFRLQRRVYFRCCLHTLRHLLRQFKMIFSFYIHRRHHHHYSSMFLSLGLYHWKCLLKLFVGNVVFFLYQLFGLYWFANGLNKKNNFEITCGRY